MEMMVVIMMRSFWKREKWTPLGLLTKPSSLFEAALHPRWTVELLPPWKNACVFRGVLQHLRKFAFLLRVWMGRLIPLSCADMWVVSKQKQIGVFPKMLNFSLNKSAAAVAAQSLTLTQMSCCAASSRGSAGGQSRTLPLSTDLKLWCFPPWGRLIDACHWGEKGNFFQLQSEQNVSSVLTSTPSAVLVHVKNTSLIFFLCLHIFVVNSHCV